DRAADASSLSDTPDTSDMSDTSEGLARPEAADLPHGQGSSLFRVQLAERRMAEALLRLEEAAGHGASCSSIAEWERAYACEVQTYVAALEALRAAERQGRRGGARSCV